MRGRTLRGLWSRRTTLAPLLLLTVVVVAGSVAVLGFADAAGTSGLLAAPLLLLGAVALPATGRELAAARRGEIVLARLRGLQSGELGRLLLAEPLLVLLLGGAVGTTAGLGVAHLVASAWLADPGPVLGAESVGVGFLVVLVALVGVLVGMAGALREPLADQLGGRPRPRTASIAAAAGHVLVVVGALVAVYRSAAGPSAADPGAATEPDLLVLAGPALIGLATGQLALLLLRRGAALAMRRPGRGAGRLGGLGGFLAARRLARLADAAASVRLLVAAAVVAGLGLTATVQTEAWADDTARLELGSAYRLDLGPVDAEDALALTRDLDPDGEHLMAAVVVPDEGRVTGRRVFLDTRRVGVLGDFLAGTPAAEVPALLEEVGDLLRGDGDGQVRGDQLVVQVAGVSARGGGRLRPQVRVDLTDQQGRTRTVEARLRLGADGAPTGTVLPIRCTEGCTLDEVVLARTRGDRDLPFLLSRLSTDTDDLLGGAWTASDGVTAVAGGLLAGTDGRTVTTEPVGSGAGAAQPVVVTRTATWEGDPVLESPGGDDRAARVLARAPALPLVAADGVLADLPRALVGASRTVPAAEVLVLAAADTPAALLAEAAEASGSEPVALEPTRLRVGEETGAAQARVYALMAGFGLLVALLVLVTAVSRERAAWRRDVAALRVAGVDAGSLRRAVRVEVGWLLVCSVAAAVAGAWLAVSLLLADLALVAVPLHAVPLTTAVAPGLLLAVAVGVGLLVAVVVGRGRALASRATRPATLREDLR